MNSHGVLDDVLHAKTRAAWIVRLVAFCLAVGIVSLAVQIFVALLTL